MNQLGTSVMIDGVYTGVDPNYKLSNAPNLYVRCQRIKKFYKKLMESPDFDIIKFGKSCKCPKRFLISPSQCLEELTRRVIDIVDDANESKLDKIEKEIENKNYSYIFK